MMKQRKKMFNYLRVVIHSQITNSVRIFPASFAVLAQNGSKIVTMVIENATQQRAILEASVHTLTEEWNHSMCRIAKQQCR